MAAQTRGPGFKSCWPVGFSPDYIVNGSLIKLHVWLVRRGRKLTVKFGIRLRTKDF